MNGEVERVPYALRLAAAIAWRAIVVAVAVALLAYALARLRVVVVPVVIATLFATFLVPPAAWLRGRGVPNGLAALAVLVAALLLVAAAIGGLVPAVTADLDEVDASVQGGFDEATQWLSDGPLGLSDARLDRWQDRAVEELRSQSSRIVGGVFGGAFLAVELLAGLVLAVVSLFFIVKDGKGMWRFAVRLFPPRAREDVDAIGRLAWETAGGYIRGIALVAFIDAVFIGLALWLIGVPFVLPLATLTFVGGFFPIVGAFVAGFAAAMVALVAVGWGAALLVVGATVLVQQLEGNLLQPLVVGHRVQLHPLAILLAVTAGGVVWGVAGAFLAVPLLAVSVRAAAHLAERPERPERKES